MSGRLGDIMRMVLGATTDGERLAAMAAFERVMVAEGLDLHEISRRIESGMVDTASQASTAGGAETYWAGDPAQPIVDALVATIPDTEWPGIATWIVEQDAQWIALHGRRILRAHQLRFAQQMQTEALTLRPSPRQGAWLVHLTFKIMDAQARPPAAARPRVADNHQAEAGGATSVVASRHTTTTATPGRKRPQLPRRRQPVPTINREDLLCWIDAVATACHRAVRPTDQVGERTFFKGEEVRVLVCIATRYRSWTIDKGDGTTMIRDDPQSAEELAFAAGVTVRSVRRALAKATASGFLAVHQAGGKGRGRRSIYRLSVPHPRDRRVAPGIRPHTASP